MGSPFNKPIGFGIDQYGLEVSPEEVVDQLTTAAERARAKELLKLYELDSAIQGALPDVNIRTPFGNFQGGLPETPTGLPAAASAWKRGVPGAAAAEAFTATREPVTEAWGEPEPVTTRPAPTTAPTDQPTATWSEEDELYFRSLRPDAVGQPSTETVSASTERPRMRARIVNGKVVFTNQEGPGEIDYDEGVDKWQENALATQQPSDPRERGLNAGGQVDDFLVRKTPARDPASQTGFRGGYIPSAEVPLTLPADAREAQAAIAAVPHMGAREMATEQWLGDEGLRQAAARRSLIEAEAGRTTRQGEAAGAESRLLGVRADQIADPVANAIRQGKASAEQILSFKARLSEQAAAEVDPAVVSRIASEMVLKKMAPNQAAAEKMAMDRLVAAKVQEFIANDPGLQRYFIQQTGSVGVGGVQ